VYSVVKKELKKKGRWGEGEIEAPHCGINSAEIPHQRKGVMGRKGDLETIVQCNSVETPCSSVVKKNSKPLTLNP
jgi:hypothetical protein